MKLNEYSKIRIQDWSGRRGRNVYSILKNQLDDINRTIELKKYISNLTNSTVKIYVFKHWINTPLIGAEFKVLCDGICVNGITAKLNINIANKPITEEMKNDLSNEFLGQIRHAFEMIAKNYQISNCRLEDES